MPQNPSDPPLASCLIAVFASAVASKTRPNNGVNCEEVWHEGQLVWGCRV